MTRTILVALVVAGITGAVWKLNLASSRTSGGETTAKRAVIVELFTSEGCSSCPPADDLLAAFDTKSPIAGVELIPLSEHVDYWNYIGWSDPFSAKQFSARQQAYAEGFAAAGMYTPQVVVDGRSECVGNDRAAVRAEIERAADAPKARVDVTLGQDGGATGVPVTVTVADPPAEAVTDEVMLAVTENGLVSTVTRGENAGRRLAHAAVTRKLVSLGPLPKPFPAAARHTIALDPAWKRSNLRIVAFIQSPKTRHIHGAGAARVGER